MKFRTPHTGPHAGRLCLVGDDGVLTPCDPVASAQLQPSVVLPVEFGRSLAHERETVDLMTGQCIEQGETPARAREIAITAARRNHGGQMGRPYTQRS